MRRTILGLGGLSFVSLVACAQAQGSGGGAGGAGAGAYSGIGGAGGGTSGTGGAPSGGSGGAGGQSAGGMGGQSSGGAAGQAGASGSGSGGTSGSGSSSGSGATGGGSGSGGKPATGGSGGAGGSGAAGGSGGSGASGGGGASGGSGGTAPKSDCCTETPNATGCTNPTVQACVCAQDKYCCQVEWDAACAAETLLYKCGTCPTPSDCCSAGKCSSDAVRECVADTDSSCSTTWTAACAAKVTTLGCGTCGGTPTSPTVWINEIHYDNAGTDTAEGVEVAGTAGSDLTGWSLVFYNGATGGLKQYMSKSLSGAIPNQSNGFGTVWTAAANIQNGGADTTPEPDGVALVDKAGKVVQFLSYEGKFTPTDGPASGVASVDIGKSETSTTVAGESLGLTGNGKKYSDFSWAGPNKATPGQPNTGQTF